MKRRPKGAPPLLVASNQYASDPDLILAQYLVSAAARTAVVQALALTHETPISMKEGLELIAADQSDPMGDSACLFLADEAEARNWRFIAGIGFVSV